MAMRLDTPAVASSRAWTSNSRLDSRLAVLWAVTGGTSATTCACQRSVCHQLSGLWAAASLQALLVNRDHIRDNGGTSTSWGLRSTEWASLRCAKHRRHLTLQEISLILLLDQIQARMA